MRVNDIEETTRFYVENFDMEITRDTIMESPQYALIFGLPKSPRMHIRFLRPKGEGTVIEAIQFLSPEKPAAQSGLLNESYANDYVGTTHVCLQVQGLEQHYERLRAKGVRFNCSPQTYTIPGVGMVSVTYMKDPNGALVELLELKQKA